MGDAVVGDVGRILAALADAVGGAAGAAAAESPAAGRTGRNPPRRREAGLADLLEGQKVSFTLVADSKSGKPSADKLQDLI